MFITFQSICVPMFWIFKLSFLVCNVETNFDCFGLLYFCLNSLWIIKIQSNEPKLFCYYRECWKTKFKIKDVIWNHKFCIGFLFILYVALCAEFRYLTIHACAGPIIPLTLSLLLSGLNEKRTHYFIQFTISLLLCFVRTFALRTLAVR